MGSPRTEVELPLAHEHGVVREHAGSKETVQLLGGDRIEGAAVSGDGARRIVAVAREVDPPRGHQGGPHHHLVAGQRARLVRADGGGGAQGLDRGQPAHDGPPTRHALHPEGQHDGGDRGEPLRHGGHGQGHPHEEPFEQGGERVRVFGPEQGQGHDGRDHEHGLAEESSHPLQLTLQRRLLLLRAPQEAGDVAQLGAHTGSGDDRAPATRNHGRAREHHVAAVGEAGVGGQGRDVFRDRRALSREGSLGGPQARGFHHPRVRGHGLALLEQQHVARHDFRRVDRLGCALAQDECPGGSELGEVGEGPLRAAFLDHGEGGVDDHDRRHREGFVGPAPVALEVPDDEGETGGGQQQQGQRVAELGDDAAPGGDGLLLFELVAAMRARAACEPRRGRGRGGGRSPGPAPPPRERRSRESGSRRRPVNPWRRCYTESPSGPGAASSHPVRTETWRVLRCPRPMPEIPPPLGGALTALLIGLLLGLDRERAQRGHPIVFAGIRTFPLVALCGYLAALGQQHGFPHALPVVLLGLMALGAVSFALHPAEGATTEVVALLAAILGAVVAWGEAPLAASLAVLAAVLLTLREPLHRFAQVLTEDEVLAVLKFAVVAVVLVPLLPRDPVGPYGAIVPHSVGVLVVILTAVSLVGYVLVRLLGERGGLSLAGALGGLVSSTAVTLSFSARARETPSLARALSVGILLASTVLYARGAFVLTVLDRPLGLYLAPRLAVLLLVGLAFAWLRLERLGDREKQKPADVSLGNPVELGTGGDPRRSLRPRHPGRAGGPGQAGDGRAHGRGTRGRPRGCGFGGGGSGQPATAGCGRGSRRRRPPTCWPPCRTCCSRAAPS